MAITYNWTFGPLEYEDDGAQTKVVKVIHWQVSGTDGTHDGRAIGTFACSDPEGDFTAYDSLTPEMVKGWLDADTIANAEAAVQSQIDAKVADAAANKGKGVPWA
jgi:hypothetical protein